MRTSELVQCRLFPCTDVRHESYIEKCKCKMIAEDIAQAMELASAA